MSKYTVFDEESESEVKTFKILEPGGKTMKNYQNIIIVKSLKFLFAQHLILANLILVNFFVFWS